jgi:YD repeat-containing protein
MSVWRFFTTISNNPAESITYTYDSTALGNKGIGRLTSVSYQAGSMSWVYDALGRVSSETRLP